MLFTNKKIFKNSKSTKSELALLKTRYNNKEEITLNNEILQKIFCFFMSRML